MMRTTIRTIFSALALLTAGAALAAQEAKKQFQPGDVIRLEIEGDTVLSGTHTVGPGPALTLPVIGAIPLTGVPRTGIEAHLRQQLAKYLKDPVIHAQSLIRLSIVGEVARPGIYAVPTDLVLADALMLAGGPTQAAQFAATRIERGRGQVVGGDRLQQALAGGLTVDDLNLRAGDRIYVPPGVRRDPEAKWRIAGLVVTAAATVFTIIRLSKP
jgi:protein involved in polysaccharide export with SLBB domain